MNAPAPIGHNMPADPYAAMQIHVEALFETAQGFLDGDPITDQQTADTVSLLIDEARKAGKDAETMRKAEAKPFDDGKAAVQAKWKPITSKLDLVADTAKRALVPFLAAQEAKRIEEARLARIEADKAAAEAQAALRAADTDLTARQAAEDAMEAAKQAEREANRIADAKTHAKGGDGRAIGLRSYWVPSIANAQAALKHYMKARPDELKDWLLDQAEKDVRAGKREIPGFTITEERRAQ